MKAWKFLARGAVGPISGFQWPPPGTWVEAAGPLRPCAHGVHVCREADLAHWLHDELWELETGGEALEARDCLVVPRARLVRQVEGWRGGGSARFAAACARRAVELAAAAPAERATVVSGLISDAALLAREGYPAICAFDAAVVAARLGDSPADEHAAYRRERAWQAEWIVTQLLAG